MSALSQFVRELKYQIDLLQAAISADDAAAFYAESARRRAEHSGAKHWTRQDINRSKYEAEADDVSNATYVDLPLQNGVSEAKAWDAFQKRWEGRRMSTREERVLRGIKRRKRADALKSAALLEAQANGTYNVLAPLIVAAWRDHVEFIRLLTNCPRDAGGWLDDESNERKWRLIRSYDRSGYGFGEGDQEGAIESLELHIPIVAASEPSAADPTEQFNPLGLALDRGNWKVTRNGKTADFGGKKKLWPFFLKVLEAGDEGIEREALRASIWGGVGDAVDKTKRRVNDTLLPLRIEISANGRGIFRLTILSEI